MGYLALGLVAGVLSGLFGIGGGVVIVSVLVTVFKQPIQSAVGTSLGALLLPVGLFGALEYYRNGNVDVHAALWIALGIAGGAYLGARFAQDVAPANLQRAFAVFLVVMAVRVWMKA